MKISLNWLKEYIDHDLQPQQLAELLTLAGLEVDAIHPFDNDNILDISLTPNLGHCANLIGIAREISASTGKPVVYPKIEVKESSKDPISKEVKVYVKNQDNCPRYACRLVRNVKVNPSPEWLRKRLEACGLSSINNVVDIVNMVVLELGQPLHAFDYDTLEGHAILVRDANKGEKFTTLDGKERILEAEDLLICDANKPVALAGIMGGLNSEVTDNTKNVLLEAAYFSAKAIRKSSKRLALSTDASKRFERGCDPNQVLQALDRAAMLLAQFAGGEVAPGVIDLAAHEFPPKQVQCRLSRINQLLGTQLGLSEVDNIFGRLGFVRRVDPQGVFTVTIPTYRVDISHEIDLIEEVARIYGYGNIAKEDIHYKNSTLEHAPIFLFEREVRARLIGERLQEILTCDLIGPTLCGIVKESMMPEEDLIRVLNPTSVEQSLLRTSLLPGLLQMVKHNIDHQNKNVNGFEIGRIHFKEQDRYCEQAVVGIVLTGKQHPYNWKSKPEDVDLFDLKGIVENLLIGLNICDFSFKNTGLPSFHSGRQASINVGALEVGSLGEVHPTILRRLDVTQRIFFAEVNLQDLIKVEKKSQKAHSLALYPSSERDWTVTVKEEMSLAEMLNKILSVPSRLREKVSLLDIYRSEKVGEGLKNVTFRFVYRDKDKTVEQLEVESEHKRITDQVLASLK